MNRKPRAKPSQPLRTIEERNTLALTCERMVYDLAKKARRMQARLKGACYTDEADLVGHGWIALLRSAELWNPVGSKSKFSTYAYISVRRAMKEYLELDTLIHVPKEFQSTNGRSGNGPSKNQKLVDLATKALAAKQCIHFDRVGDALTCDTNTEETHTEALAHYRVKYSKLLGRFPQSTRNVLELLKHGHSYVDIALKLSMTPEQARKVAARAIEIMRLMADKTQD